MPNFPNPEKIPPVDNIELGGFSLDLRYFLCSEYDDVSLANIELPPVIEWVNSNLQAYTEQKICKENAVKELIASEYFRLLKGGFEQDGYAGVKKTAVAILHATNLNPALKLLRDELATLEGWCQRLYNLQCSLQSKLDLVRSSEATRRRAFDSHPTQ